MPAREAHAKVIEASAEQLVDRPGAEIISNLKQRIEEAIDRHWLGEVQGLQISMDAVQAKLTAMDRIARTTAFTPTLLGLPTAPGRHRST